MSEPRNPSPTPIGQGQGTGSDDNHSVTMSEPRKPSPTPIEQGQGTGSDDNPSITMSEPRKPSPTPIEPVQSVARMPPIPPELSVARMPSDNSYAVNPAQFLQMQSQISKMTQMINSMVNQQPQMTQTPPWNTSERVELRLADGGKSKTHVIVSPVGNTNIDDQLMFPVEFLDYANEVFTDVNERKRRRTDNDNNSSRNENNGRHETSVVPSASNNVVPSASNNVARINKPPQKCRVCGCVSTPDNPVTNQGCVKHYRIAALYKRENQRKNRRDPTDIDKRNCLPLVSISANTFNKFNRVVTYQRDVILPSSQLAAYFGEITREIGPWRCLKKHGLAYVSNVLEMTEEQHGFLIQNMDNWDWNDQLFTSFEEGSCTEIFQNDTQCNRWVTTDKEHIKFISQWNNLENTITQWLNNRNNFPISGQPWKLTFSAFKTSALMPHPQAYHLDVGPHSYCYSNNNRWSFFFIQYNDRDRRLYIP